MPGLDGLGFLAEVRARALDLAVILVTGFGSIESAVEAMHVGAADYLTKPVDLYELRKRVTTHLEKRQLQEKVADLQRQLGERPGFEGIIGRSAAMERLFEQMKLVAPTRSNVLIIGESGTGKELVANAIHRASPRRDQRFLAINCGAIPSDILESELFGHERGSFTGAIGRKIGKFELAHRGTLFLDEISRALPRAAGQAAARARGAPDHAGRRLASCSRSTSGWWRRPTGTSRRRSPTGASARISTTG